MYFFIFPNLTICEYAITMPINQKTVKESVMRRKFECFAKYSVQTINEEDKYLGALKFGIV